MCQEIEEKVLQEVFMAKLTAEGFDLVLDQCAIGMKLSHFARAEEIARQMGVPVSHVIGQAARQLFHRLSQGSLTGSGKRKIRQPKSAIKDLLEFQDDLIKRETVKTTSAQLAPVVYRAIEGVCGTAGVTKVCFFGFAIQEYWDYRKSYAKREAQKEST